MSAFRKFIRFLGLSTHVDPLEVGDRIPNLQARDHDGTLISLPDFVGAGFTLIYFYPKADTPGCTAQACSLRDQYSAITARGVQIVGVSTDKPEALREFRQKYNLGFRLISDPDAKVIQEFGVRRIFGMASRQAYLFKNGVVVWRDLGASTSRQADDLLHAMDLL